MSNAPLVQRHPALRWLAPLAVVGLAGLAATGVLRAQASSESSDSLPATTPAALLSAVQEPKTSGFSGTVVSRLSLGLPELPSLAGDDESGSSMTSLLSGSHTLQVWYGGPTQQRVALLGATDETDLFRSGRQLWRWTSADREAVHAVLPAVPRGNRLAEPSMSDTSTATPSDVARDVLRDLDPSTRVTVNHDHSVANRSAYELVLQPRTSATRVGSVHIAVDGRTMVPLAVQVFARGATTPAVDVAYTSIRFERPSSTTFSFTPPSNANVRTVQLPQGRRSLMSLGGQPAAASSRLQHTGSGWTTVVSYQPSSPRQVLRTVDAGPLAPAFTSVSGSWGKGHLCTSDLASVLVTDKGRVLVGAVDPESLYAAAR